MAKIKVLEEQLANQIAAGEVVERPASVVKELVENAVDAGSTTIDIAVQDGGLASIRVTDNGFGIEAADLPTAFQRHATSKIATSSDLFRIASLGFRGEALPSIAAVSRLDCFSADSSTGLARRIVIEGGSITVDEAANAPQGTDITVRDLFYNTPARLKYMKAIQTELGHISDYINRIALAHPGIAITFKHNGNVLLRTLGTGDRLQVIAAVYGTNTAKTMLQIEAETPDYELRGYISKPELTRANRNGITVIVNGRYIRSHAVNQALLQGYHTLLPINRYPLAVLELGMHPGLLDVNVHPSKMEVRFSKEPELRTMIEEAVKQVLGRQRYIPGPDAGKKQDREKPAFVQDAISFYRQEQPDAPLGPINRASASAQSAKGSGPSSYSSRQPEREYVPPQAAERLYSPPETAPDYQTLREAGPSRTWPEPPPLEYSAAAGNEPPISDTGNLRSGEYEAAQQGAAALERESGDANGQVADASAPYAEPSAAPADKPAFPELYWIGQHHGTYIIAQAEDGLYLIDQHAAHERINYEYYYQKFGNPQAASQTLLVPLTLEFTAGEAEQLRGLLPLFEQAGVELESFGAQTFLVRSYPEWFPQGDEHEVLEEMAELLIAERKSIDIAKLREKAAIMCSCKASIKANDRLSREEGETLLARLAACMQPYTCPHGRPIIVHLSSYQLEKMFKRVMS
jgi:DNA mismatch repair protein MutL